MLAEWLAEKAGSSGIGGFLFDAGLTGGSHEQHVDLGRLRVHCGQNGQAITSGKVVIQTEEIGPQLQHLFFHPDTIGKRADDWRKKIEALNPKDSYHHVAAARFELARGNIPSAYRYADLLERAGTRGAVAVLLYHDLRKTDTIDSISEDSFRAQMRGLLDAGFRFVKIDEVPRMMRDSGARRIAPKTGVPERIVAVCLDVPAAESLRLADRVADDLDIVVSAYAGDKASLFLFANDGAGAFTDASAGNLSQGRFALDVESIDLTGDGFMDLLTLHDGTSGRNRILVNDKNGKFTDSTDLLWPKLANGSSFDFSTSFYDYDSNKKVDWVIGVRP